MEKSVNNTKNKNTQDDTKFHAIFENSFNAILLGIPDNGAVLEANAAAVKMFGYSLKELRSLNRNAIFDNTDPKMISALKIREKEGKTKGELIGIRKNGERFPCEFTSTIFKNESDERRTSTILTDITERKKIEEEIQLLLNNTEESFVLIDKDLKIVSFNDQFKIRYKLLFKKNTQKGDSILDYAQENRRDTVKAIYLKVLEGETIEDEITITDSEKGIIYFFIRYKPAVDQYGNIIGAFVTSRDITQKRQAEQLIINNEKRFHSIIEHASDIVSLTDEKGQIIYISPSLEEIIGLTNEEVKGTSYELLVHPNDRKNAKIIFNKLLQKPGAALPRTVRILRKNGSYIWVEGIVTNLLNNENVKAIVSNCRDITERKLVFEKLKNSEEKLKESHAQLTKLTENVDTVVYQFEISPDGKMTFPFMSKSITKIVPDIDIELLKEDASEAFSTVHPDDLPSLLLSIEESRKNLTDWKFEYRSIAFKDKITWIKGASHPNKKEDGTIVWYGYLLDITDRIISNEKIQESNNRYEIIEKATNDTIWESDFQTFNIVWNKGISRVFGYDDKDEIINHTSWWYSKIHPDDLQRVKKKAEKCFEKKETRWEDEYRFLCADNTYKYVSDKGYLIKNKNGEPIKMIGAMQDVTSQKQEELRLKLLESVITNTTDSVVITEPDAKTGDQLIIFVNEPFIKMTGYRLEELIGKSPRMLGGLKTDKKELNKVRRAISNYEECQTEIINYNKNGEEYWVNMSISPVINELGKPTHFIAIEKDVTERKLREIEREQIIAELSQNNKDLKQFSYVTSHNLRAPIANLLGLTTLIEQYKIPNKTLKIILDGVRQSALIFDDTVKDLTKVLIIKDQINIVKEKISITEITNNVLSQLGITVDDNEVKVNYDFKEAPFVNFTKAYLESVLLNLFTNSIKYKSPKRKLKINILSSNSSDFITVKFSDNGIGIDTERHKEKLFKLYQRFHDNPDGKGLGLYLIKSQIEALGGTIDVQSEVNVGTTFIITFKK
jgi:PAS domain S-box-containing protein